MDGMREDGEEDVIVIACSNEHGDYEDKHTFLLFFDRCSFFLPLNYISCMKNILFHCLSIRRRLLNWGHRLR